MTDLQQENERKALNSRHIKFNFKLEIKLVVHTFLAPLRRYEEKMTLFIIFIIKLIVINIKNYK